MSKYRILEVKKAGYYKLYTVQEKAFLFFWEHCRSFDTVAEAKRWLEDQQVKQVTTVVHIE